MVRSVTDTDVLSVSTAVRRGAHDYCENGDSGIGVADSEYPNSHAGYSVRYQGASQHYGERVGWSSSLEAANSKVVIIYRGCFEN